MGTTIFQIIFILMLIGAVGAVVFKVLKAALGCLVLGVVTVLIGVVLYGVIQAFAYLAHLFG